MTYRFNHYYRNFQPGDLVPETWTMGIIGTLKARGVVSEVSEPPFVPENKAVKPGRVKTKGVASDEPGSL